MSLDCPNGSRVKTILSIATGLNPWQLIKLFGMIAVPTLREASNKNLKYFVNRNYNC